MDKSTKPGNKKRYDADTGSDSAVSEIIGGIIMFGFIIILLVVFQVTAVPIWNQSVEFEHNQRVQGDMGQLYDSVVLSSTTGRSTTQSVELGTQYPRRAFFINPSDPVGEIRTLEPGNVVVENVESGDADVGDYWDGTAQRFDTRSIQYMPRYNELQSAPRTVIDNTVMFNGVRGNTATTTRQSVVSGRNINLNLVGGNLSTSGVFSSGVNVNPVSAPSQRLSVSNSTENITITLPTQLSRERWLEAGLQDELVRNGGHVQDVSYQNLDGTYNNLTLTMEPGVEYNLRMSRVAVGERGEAERQENDEHYIVNRGSDQRNVATGATERIEVEVRDRYNNPVSGVDVNTVLQAPAGEDPGILTPLQPRTDAEGVASFEYEAPADPTTAGIEFNILNNDTARERVNVAIDVTDSAGGGGGGGGGTGDVGSDTDQGLSSGVLLKGVSSIENPGKSVARLEFEETQNRPSGDERSIVAGRYIFFHESNPGGGAAPDNILLGGTSLPYRGETQTLSTPITLTSGTNIVDFQFRNGANNYQIRDQDFVYFHLEFSDGTSSTYIVQLQSPGGGGGGGPPGGGAGPP